MNTPRFLLGATLLFWGWQAGCLEIAAGLAVVLEGARWLPARWDFEERDFDRFWNLCAVLFLGAAVYVLSARTGPHVLGDRLNPPNPDANSGTSPDQVVRASLAFIQWWPLAIFPFLLAQTVARQPGVDWGTFALVLRSRRASDPRPPAERRNLVLGYPYFALCLGCGCIGQPAERVSFPAIAGLLLWAVWRDRPRRFALPLWAAVALAAVALGFAGQRGLRFLYAEVQDYTPSWLGASGGRADARESHTSIGHIGRLKLSGTIVLRVEPRAGSAPPGLLREASYDTFKSPSWFATGSNKEFRSVAPGPEETTWLLRRGRAPESIVDIAGYLPGGRGLLALPNGVARLEQLPATSLKTNGLGAVRVEAGPGFYALECRFGPGAGIDSPPTTEDLNVPEPERAATVTVAAELKLSNQPPRAVLERLARFFSEQFQYSLERGPRPERGTNDSPIARFLLRDRTGHCEHFATATALLLRQAGIPARYAAGYAVQEKAGSGFVVRERHAHAWCLAYLDGAWQDFDTTPAAWSASDAARAAWFEPLADAWSRVWYEFNKLRYGQSALRRYLGWFVLGLFVLVAGQLVLGRRWRQARQQRRALAAQPDFPGLDSELYRIERALAERGYPREPGENLTDWLSRLRTVPSVVEARGALETILRLHSRYRFDPVGLGAAERETLRAEAVACLERLRRKSGENAS